MDYRDTRTYAIRMAAVIMVCRASASHLGSALSMVDLLAVLYGEALRVNPANPKWAERDRFILSKGHACVPLYAALANRGFFSAEELSNYGKDGSRLMSHISHEVPGVEFSTGSLGHGLPFGCGKALAAKRKKEKWRSFVLLSDGELDEGSNWEPILFAPQHRLDSLVVIVDYNKIQSLGSVPALSGRADTSRGWSRDQDGVWGSSLPAGSGHALAGGYFAAAGGHRLGSYRFAPAGTAKNRRFRTG